MKTRLLYISYAYPPLGSPGALRAEAMSRWLARMGIQVWVLTTRAAHSQVRQGGWVGDVEGRHVIRVSDPLGGTGGSIVSGVASSRLGVARFLSGKVPFDPRMGWALASSFRLRRMSDLIRQTDVVLTTGPPVSTHWVGYRLKKARGVPWVMELRDLWTLGPTYRAGRVRRRIEEHVERRWLDMANCVVVVSRECRRALAEAYPNCKEKIRVVRNGADAEWPGSLTAGAEPVRRGVRVTYAGSLYGGQRDITPLLEAIRKVRLDGSIRPGELRLSIYGWDAVPVASKARLDGIADMVEVKRPISYAEMRGVISASDATVVITMPGPKGAGELTTKYFDSLAARCPVILIADEGQELVELHREVRGGWYFPRSDVEGMALLLKKLVEAKRSGVGIPRLPLEAGALFTREAAARGLGDIIATLIREKRGDQ